MEEEASNAHQKIPNKGDDKDSIMAIFSAAYKTRVGKVYENQVGQGIDYLGHEWSGIVVLAHINKALC